MSCVEIQIINSIVVSIVPISVACIWKIEKVINNCYFHNCLFLSWVKSWDIYVYIYILINFSTKIYFFDRLFFGNLFNFEKMFVEMIKVALIYNICIMANYTLTLQNFIGCYFTSVFCQMAHDFWNALYNKFVTLSEIKASWEKASSLYIIQYQKHGLIHKPPVNCFRKSSMFIFWQRTVQDGLGTHGLCGYLNHNSLCMRDFKVFKGFLVKQGTENYLLVIPYQLNLHINALVLLTSNT